MKEFFKVDLRIARQRSGLKGQDVALLLGISPARLSKLENGYARPKVKEIIGFSLIYGRPLDELFQLTSSRLTEKLKENLSELDFLDDADGDHSEQRMETLNQLTSRLRVLHQDSDGA